MVDKAKIERHISNLVEYADFMRGGAPDLEYSVVLLREQMKEIDYMQSRLRAHVTECCGSVDVEPRGGWCIECNQDRAALNKEKKDG